MEREIQSSWKKTVEWEVRRLVQLYITLSCLGNLRSPASEGPEFLRCSALVCFHTLRFQIVYLALARTYESVLPATWTCFSGLGY